jgi:hypothetical protein
MTQAAKRPATAARRTGGSQATLNGDGPRGEQYLRGDQDLVGDRDRDDGTDRDDRTERDERDSRDEQGDQRPRTERGEQDLRREQGRAGDLDDKDRRETGDVRRTVEQVSDRVKAATSNPLDAFAGTPDISKVVTAWFDVAGDMMKLQQQFFATVLGAATTNARTTTKV